MITKSTILRRLYCSLLLASGLAASAAVLAHHSTAMFDMTKEVQLDGVIKAYQWTNPHSYLQVVVPNGKGGEEEWGIESGAPELGLRMGWTKNSVKPGDKVKVVIVPLRSGEHGEGILKSITLPDGKVLYGPGYRPAPPAGGPPGGGPPPGGSVLPQLERATPKQPQ
jgi:hypothetical protein